MLSRSKSSAIWKRKCNIVMGLAVTRVVTSVFKFLICRRVWDISCSCRSSLTVTRRLYGCSSKREKSHRKERSTYSWTKGVSMRLEVKWYCTKTALSRIRIFSLAVSTASCSVEFCAVSEVFGGSLHVKRSKSCMRLVCMDQRLSATVWTSTGGV